MKVVDLTRPLVSGMPVFPGDPPVAVERVRTHDEDGFEVSRVCVGSHSGTHVDAPRHFFPEGATLDEFPAGRFVGRGVIVDLRQTRPGGREDRPPAPTGAALARTIDSCIAASLSAWEIVGCRLADIFPTSDTGVGK